MKPERINCTSKSGKNTYQYVILYCSKCNKQLKRRPSYKPPSGIIFCNKCANNHFLKKEKDCSTSKICNSCCQNLPIENFQKTKAGTNYLLSCKKCRNLKRFGINTKEYKEMLEKQGNCCAICNTFQKSIDNRTSSKIRDFPVDHDHKTSKIRGILCTNCNTGLGNFRDNPLLLLKAIEYLEKLSENQSKS